MTDATATIADAPGVAPGHPPVIASEAPPPPLPRRWDGSRIAGIAVLALMGLLVLALARFLWSSWDPTFFERFGGKYWSGLLITLQLVAWSTILGFAVSIPVALARMSANPALRYPAKAYIGFFRGTPLLAQLFLIYYGLGQFRDQLDFGDGRDAWDLWTFFSEPWLCAVFVFTIHTAAYQAEILRGAIRSVDKGQWEGAAALGLRRARTFRSVIMPQALLVALRPYGNEIVLMTKASALVAIVTVLDVFGEARRAYSRTFDFQAYIWAALVYLTLVIALEATWSRIERRLTRHLKR